MRLVKNLCALFVMLSFVKVLNAQETLNQIEVTHRIETAGIAVGLAVSPSGSHVGVLSLVERSPTAKTTATLTIWDLANKSCVSEQIQLNGAAGNDLVFTPSGENIVVTDSGQVRLYNCKTRKWGKSVPGRMTRVTGNSIVITSPIETGPAKIGVYVLESLAARFETEFPNLLHCDVSPDEAFLIGSDGKTLRVFEIESGTRRPDMVMASKSLAVSISSGGNYTAVSSELPGKVNLEIYEWNNESKSSRLQSRLDSATIGRCDTVRFLNDKVIAIPRSINVCFWDILAKKEVALGTITATGSGSKGVLSDKTTGQDTIASSNCVHVFDPRSNTLAVSVNATRFKLLAHSHRGNVIAVFSDENGIEVNRLRTDVENLSMISKTVFPYNQLNNFKLDELDCTFSDDGSIACIHGFHGLNLGHRLIGVYETSTGKQIEVSPSINAHDHSRISFPIVYFDKLSQTFNFLSVVSQGKERAKKAQFNWLMIPTTVGRAVIKPAKFDVPIGLQIERSSTPFHLPDGRLVVVVHGVVQGMTADMRPNPLLLLELPSGKIVRVLSENLKNVKNITSLAGPRDIIISSNAEFAALNARTSKDQGRNWVEGIMSWNLGTGNPVGDPLLGSRGSMFGFSNQTLCADAEAGDLNGNSVQFSDVKDGKYMNSVTMPGKVVFAPHADRFLHGGSRGELVWGDLVSGKTISNATPHSTKLFRALFSRDGKYLLTVADASFNSGSDLEIRFWKTPKAITMEPIDPVILRP